jgi:hypothetical protein
MPEGMGSMKIQNWSKMDIDRETWKRTVQQAKTHRYVAPKCPDQPWGPRSLQFNGYGGFSPREAVVKQPAHEVNHSFSSMATLKNEYSYTPIPCMPSWHKKGKLCLLIPLMCVHQCEEQAPVPSDLFHDIHCSAARHQP